MASVDDGFVFAEEGLWYDAIDSVSLATAQHPAGIRYDQLDAR